MVSYGFLSFEISQDITMDIEAEEHDTNFITPEKKQYEDDIEEEEEEPQENIHQVIATIEKFT